MGNVPVYMKNWTKEDSDLACFNEVFECLLASVGIQLAYLKVRF